MATSVAEMRQSPVEQALIPAGTIISDLLGGLRIEQTSYRTFAAADIPIEGRSHADELIGFFVTEGAVSLSIFGGDTIRANRHDYLLLSRDTRYAIDQADGAPPCAIGRVTFKLDNSFARLLFRLLPNVIFIDRMGAPELEWLLMLDRLIKDHPGSISPASTAINHRLIEASVIGVIQMSLHRDRTLGYQFDNPDVARIFVSLRAMHRGPERPWTVTALARASGMSRTLFASTFLRVTGETPARYLGILRLDKARELLRSSPLPLLEIAQRAGYGTDAAFIRAFKRQFGLTPGRFRSDGRESTERH